ncbi:lipid A export permease/ATP-binding protein MsbA [Limnohabitans sp. Rim8]|uniref:lipid A export permease/ATP-binding protein MsbA n=1 Tax=Limnohabitans sp. Rim8 TaxID=1100718 RepID=UPI002636260F|nr:lipid A export permease/ATP-binding protein MsbA [Limnohabitans sp. Rim8]
MTETTPSAPPPIPVPLLQRLKRLIPYFGQLRWAWVAGVLAALVAAITEPLIPALFQPLLDKGFSKGALPLWSVPVAVIGIFAIRGAAHFVSQYSLTRIANDGMQLLRSAMFDRLMKAELAIFSKESSSALSNTIVYEVQSGAGQLVSALIGLSRDGFSLIALIAYLFFLNWKLTLVVFVVTPGVAWIMKVLSKRLYRLTRESQTATDDLAYVVEENVLAYKMVRLHQAQTGQMKRFEILSDRLRGLAIRSTIASASMSPLTQLLAAVALSLVLMIALVQSQNGAEGATVGGFVAFITAMLMLIAPIKRLADVANPITRGLAALERGLQLMEDVACEAQGHYVPAQMKGSSSGSGVIEWVDVSVQFHAEAAPALESLSLKVQPGESVAFVGPSGSGKTTLANLLPRFVLPSKGQILVGGRDVSEWQLSALRQQMAMVSQDVVMLNDTLAANVALGQSVEEDKVNACLTAANLSEYVDRLPQGMHTLLGHNATQLSGGQRQRLAIARALYKDAPILILDEATSALDNESERLVQDALQRLMKGRTTLIIAHRLSTIEHADRIVVMSQGKILEQGTHQVLLALGGAYARLHNKSEFEVSAL